MTPGGAARRVVVWIDAQLPPVMAQWLIAPGVETQHVVDLGLLRATDTAIWKAARDAGAVVITKDVDFVDRVQRLGAPPQIVWVRVGNASNRLLQSIFAAEWSRAVDLLRSGEALILLGR